MRQPTLLRASILVALSSAAGAALAACGNSSAGPNGPLAAATGSSSGNGASSGTSSGSTSTSSSGADASANTASGSSSGARSSGTPGADASADGNSSSVDGGALGGSGAPAAGWGNVAIGGGGFVTGIVFSPAQQGLVYARTDVGGFYRWTDAAGAWVPLTDSFPASEGNLLGGESIAPDPTNPQIVYAAGGMYESSGNGAILRSTDQGTTWTVNAIDVPMGGNENGRGMGERLAVDPNNDAILFFGTRSRGLYKSIDSATTWTPVTSFPTMGDAGFGLPVVVIDPSGGGASGSNTIYVAAATKGAGSNLYVSQDAGVTWSAVSGGPSGLMVHHASLGSDGTLWLAYSSDYGPFNTGGGTLVGQIWKLETTGGVWTNVTPPTSIWGGMAGGISVDATNPLHVVASTLDWYAPDRVLATTDGGSTWHVIASPPVSYNPNGSTYDPHGVNYWNLGGQFIGTGPTNWVEAVALDPFNADRVMYGTGAGIWTSTDIQAVTGTNGEGVTWTFVDTGLEETVPIYLVPSVSGAFLGAIGDLGGMRNTDLDAYSATGEYSNPVFSNTNWLDFAESNPNFVVRVGNSGEAASDVAFSNDNGQTWKPCSTAPPGYTTDNEMGSVAVSADGSRFIVSPFAGFGSPAVTADDGGTWQTSTGLPSGALVASDRVSASTFYATSGGNLYASTDGGATFVVVNTFTGSGAPRAVFGEAGEVWVAANGGALYRFTSSGAVRSVIAAVTSANGVGFGKAAPGQSHPATFVIGTVAGQYGFFRSDDGLGAAWTRFNDSLHQYGWLQANFIAGDENVYERAYLTTSGRGYVHFEP